MGEGCEHRCRHRPIAGVRIGYAWAEAHRLGVLHAHRHRYEVFPLQDLAVVKPTIGEPGFFSLSYQVTGPVRLDKTFETNTKFHFSTSSIGATTDSALLTLVGFP